MPSPGVTHLGVFVVLSLGSGALCPVSPRIHLTVSQTLEFQHVPSYEAFLHRFWKLNSDLHANTLTTEQIISSMSQ